MFEKWKDFYKLWIDDKGFTEWAEVQEKKTNQFDYSAIDSVTVFEGTHPAVMQDLIKKEDWEFNMDIRKKNFKNTKHKVLYFLWKNFGWRPFEYSNYKRI